LQPSLPRPGGSKHRTSSNARHWQSQWHTLTARQWRPAGVGLVTALVLRAAAGRFDRFRTGKQLARYCGLTPCNTSSGERQADAGRIDAGNPQLRAVLIQLAKRLPRHVNRWRQLQAKLRRMKPANVVSAAIANCWMRQLFHVMTEQRELAERQAA